MYGAYEEPRGIRAMYGLYGGVYPPETSLDSRPQGFPKFGGFSLGCHKANSEIPVRRVDTSWWHKTYKK